MNEHLLRASSFHMLSTLEVGEFEKLKRNCCTRIGKGNATDNDTANFYSLKSVEMLEQITH